MISPFLSYPSLSFYCLLWPSTSFPGLSLGIPVLLLPCVWSAMQLTRTLQKRAGNAQNIAEPISMHDTGVVNAEIKAVHEVLLCIEMGSVIF